MDPEPLLVIHEVIPREILVMIFEEHAKLEWRAPATDGRVCHLWRQIVLNTPRAWAYLEIRYKKPPNFWNLLMWLDRSRTAPLHIRVDRNFTLNKPINDQSLYDLLSQYHTRIASLRMDIGDLGFFKGRDFPCMRLLDVARWNAMSYSLPPAQWGAMPELQSLRLGRTDSVVGLMDGIAPLKTLALHIPKFTSLSRHSPSLVALMLRSVSLGDTISSSLDFPSLTHLSLYRVGGLKPHINAPCLAIYHEGRCTVSESFSAPVPSLVEYGVRGLHPQYSDPTKWHCSFPNILRLSIRADPPLLISFLDSLSSHPHPMPALQMISVGSMRMWGAELLAEYQGIMGTLVRVRSERCLLDIGLYFEMGRPSHIPMFFGNVSNSPSDDL